MHWATHGSPNQLFCYCGFSASRALQYEIEIAKLEQPCAILRGPGGPLVANTVVEKNKKLFYVNSTMS